MWKWLGIIVAVLVAIPVVLAAIGMFLPKGHVASRRIAINAPPDRVFAAISDPARISASDPPVLVEESLPNTRMVTRVAPNLSFGGTWTFELKPTSGGGTELTITEDGEIYNPIFRTLQKLFFSPYKTIDTYQADLVRGLH